jgi:thioredoxin 1
MRLNRAVWVVTALSILQTPARGQSRPSPIVTTTASAPASSEFEPLDRWTVAVLAGDKVALAALYSTNPPSEVQTPQGKTEDPAGESVFWSAFAAKGIDKFDPKILEIQKPQPGVVALVLRIELTLGKNPAEPYVVSAAQVWVQQDVWRIAATQRSDLTPASPSRLPEPAKPNTALYPSADEASADIDAALHAAAKDGKRVILEFGGNWCFDCHVLDAAFHSTAIAPLVEANYHLVHVNIGEFDKNLDLTKKYDTPLDKGVPALAVLDADGKVIYSQKQGEFESSARLDTQDLIQFLEKWKPVRRD